MSINKINNQKYYENVEQSVYDYQKEYTVPYLETNMKAYRFFGKDISYKKSDKQLEDIAKVIALSNGNQNKKGEIIAVISPMLPEVISSFYGINKNGAIFFPIDPRTNTQRICDFLNLADVKVAIVFDQAYAKIDAIIDKTQLEDVYIVSVMDSMFRFLGLSYHFDQMNKAKQYRKMLTELGLENSTMVSELLLSYKKKRELTEHDVQMVKNLEVCSKLSEIAAKNIYYTNPPKTGYTNLKDAISLVKELPQVSSVYDPSIPASLTLTSGTTGKPKVVPTMNRSYNVKVRDYAYTTMPIEERDRILSMPPFILYGETFMHMAYVRGVQNVIIPDITACYYPDVIRKQKISHAVGVPSQALTLAEDKDFNKKPPRTLKSVSVGGTRMLKDHEKRINEALQPLDIKVTQGYSMSELTPASITNMPGAIKEGSVGRLIGDTKALVVHPETLEILGPNEVGILLIKSETQFDGYYKNEEGSQKVFVEKNGEIYVNTMDLAYYDDDGYYYISERAKEMIIRPDGHNNFPSEMEDLIVSHPMVEDCSVVGFPFPDYNSPLGEYPKAHVVLKEEYVGQEVFVEELLRQFCKENLPERDVPYYYEFHKTLPLTPVLKVDKMALVEMDKQEFLQHEQGKRKIKKENRF